MKQLNLRTLATELTDAAKHGESRVYELLKARLEPPAENGSALSEPVAVHPGVTPSEWDRAVAADSW